MLRFGIISDIDPAKGLARVNWNDDDIVSDWLPILYPKTLRDSFSWFPDINEHVACLCDEHSDNGVIMGAIYSEATAPNGGNKDKYRVRFEDGTVIEYDRAAKKLLADVKGQVEVKATGAIKAETPTTATLKATQVTIDAPAVTVTGILQVGQLSAAPGASAGNGNVAISGNLIVTSGDVTADGISLKTHRHGGVQSGGSQTTPPV